MAPVSPLTTSGDAESKAPAISDGYPPRYERRDTIDLKEI